MNKTHSQTARRENVVFFFTWGVISYAEVAAENTRFRNWAERSIFLLIVIWHWVFGIRLESFTQDHPQRIVKGPNAILPVSFPSVDLFGYFEG